MAANTKIDSNITGLSYAEETDVIGVLPGTPVWIALEPNGYNDFGGNLTTVARNPINPSRQRSKGVVTDLDASGGFNTDITQDNLQDLLQGFFFADLRRKGEFLNAPGIATRNVAAANTNSRLTCAGTPAFDLTTDFAIGDLVFVSGFSNAANNGVFAVGALTATTFDLNQADGTGTPAVLVDEVANSNVSIVRVGIEGTAGDIDVDVTGSRPALTSTTLDFTTLGLIVGEFIFVGGDAADNAFTNAANNGFARVRSIAAQRLEFDKTQGTMVDEASTTENIHLYFGRVLKNEQGGLIKRRTYQLERTLGKADTTDPNDQSEYLVGSLPNEFGLTIATADKMTADVNFVSTDNEQRTGIQGPKAGTRVPITSGDAFNTSSDFSRIKLATVDEANANPDPLFAFATDISININNGITPDKAIGTLGAFEATTGQFAVSGEITAYFANIAAVQAVRNNADITLDAFLVKSNSGICIDLPLLTLGDGRANVEQDAPITLPLSKEAARGGSIDPNLDHTMLMVFYDYLPNLADS